MGAIGLDLSEFENPAPTRTPTLTVPPVLSARSPSPSAAEDENLKDHPPLSRSRKRKLPYRADVVVEGRRYKGKRVSRGEAELDVEALGLRDESDDYANQEERDDLSADEADSDLSDLRDDIEEEENIEVEAENERDRRVVSGRAERLQAEEKAVAARLAQEEKKDIARALAVRKQKEMYDAVVDLRIRMEPLVSLARQFPPGNEREGCDSWSSREDLDASMKEADGALATLLKQADKAWVSSFPSGEHNVSDGDFEKWRDAVLDRWGTKVNEASGIVPKGGFKTIDTTVSAQLKASLASGKHLNRTRRVKESIVLLGSDLEMSQGVNVIQFDDGDLYRTLLREIIESGDGAGGGLRYAQLSKAGKVKRKRDRSFAKGRRLKYDIHEKLVGFLAPVPLPDPGPLDEIVAALFGKRGTVIPSVH